MKSLFFFRSFLPLDYFQIFLLRKIDILSWKHENLFSPLKKDEKRNSLIFYFPQISVKNVPERRYLRKGEENPFLQIEFENFVDAILSTTEHFWNRRA